MKFFKQLIVTVALAMSAFAAHADTFVGKDIGVPGDFNNTWTFLGSNDTAHAAGDQFNDFFIFNVPDTQYISVTLTSLLRGKSDGVSFLDGGFLIYTYSDGDVVAAVDASLSNTVTGGAWLLGSGTYGLYVAGSYLLNGGNYGGQILGTPVTAVPEPSSILMLLAGMALVAGVAQRRRRS
jgi:hypothetical protein